MLSKLGNFEVIRTRRGEIRVRHLPTKLWAGTFSHLSVKSVRAACAGVNAVEADMRADALATLRGGPDAPGFGDIAFEWGRLMLAQFPNGAWTRY